MQRKLHRFKQIVGLLFFLKVLCYCKSNLALPSGASRLPLINTKMGMTDANYRHIRTTALCNRFVQGSAILKEARHWHAVHQGCPNPTSTPPTWAGALEERWVRSPILAAARGSLELMRTGALISMECRLLAAWDDLCVMLRAVKEWRFLAFFLPSACRWAAPATPAPASVEHGARPAAAAAAAATAVVSVGSGTSQPEAAAEHVLSISMSCLADSFSCVWRKRER